MYRMNLVLTIYLCESVLCFLGCLGHFFSLCACVSLHTRVREFGKAIFAVLCRAVVVVMRRNCTARLAKERHQAANER